MNNKFTVKEKDNILLVGQQVFWMLYPIFERGKHGEYSRELAFVNNLPEGVISRFTSCIKKHRGINNTTFPLTQRQLDIVEMIADLNITELDELIKLNNTNKEWDLHQYLKDNIKWKKVMFV